jgi:hypothetical protein
MRRVVFFVLMSGILLLSTFTQANLVSAVSEKKLSVPEHAVEIAPGLYHLGKAKDKDGNIVEGIMIIDNRKEEAKPGGAGGKGGNACYSFLASGAKWKIKEPWIVNTSNAEGLDPGFVFGNQAANIQKWESAGAGDVFGAGTETTTLLEADETSPDGANEVYFGVIDDPNTIAVTIVWGIFSGPVKQRYLAEWDQIYDTDSFDWSSVGEAGKMDFENISTHETGHAFGMGHPGNSCTEETMFAFASNGETKKRDLNSGDIAGINALY